MSGSSSTVQQRPRASRTVRDMLWSLGVVLAVVVLVLLVTKRPAPDPVRVVDVGPTLSAARAAAAYPVLAPTDLGPQWRATSARWQPTPASGDVPAWHLGMLAPDGTYVQVAQAALPRSEVSDYVDEQSLGGRQDGSSTVAGRVYERRYAPESGERALVAVDAGVVTVVSGTADWEVLEAFAGALSGG